MSLFDLITYPLITEKSTVQAQEENKYSFRVRPSASKGDIKLAIEQAFNVKVVKVNTMLVRGKWRRIRFQPGYAPNWKKATVTLKEGDKIWK